MLRTTHTYALLEVSVPVYEEIKELLTEAGYEHAFGPDGEIDMHGIALIERVGTPTSPMERSKPPLAEPKCPPSK